MISRGSVKREKFPSLVSGSVTNRDKRVAFCLGLCNQPGLKVYLERDFNSFPIFPPHFLNLSLCNILKKIVSLIFEPCKIILS
jgi:hypothetical protein